MVGKLDLPAIGQFPVQRNHLPEQLHLLLEQPLLFVFGPVAALVAKLGQFFVQLERQRMDPSQVRPALQIEDVALRESLGGPGGRIDRQAALLIQLVVAREGPDHLVRMDHEEVVEQIVHVVGRPGRRPATATRARCVVFVPLLGVGQQLHEQAGHQIDRGLELGNLLELHGHAPIILGAVQADPGHRVFAGHVVG